VIGTLTAYYDPEMQKSNNPFCAIGLRKDSLVTLLDDINSPTASYPLIIDSETLAVTIIGF